MLFILLFKLIIKNREQYFFFVFVYIGHESMLLRFCYRKRGKCLDNIVNMNMKTSQ